MTNVEIYLGALEAHDIPVYVVQGTEFYQKSEVSDLIAFLELVLHPQDELLRAIVLTSSLFGIPIGALGQWGQPPRPRSSGAMGAAPIDPQFEELLQYWVDRRDSATTAEILQDVIR